MKKTLAEIKHQYSETVVSLATGGADHVKVMRNLVSQDELEKALECATLLVGTSKTLLKALDAEIRRKKKQAEQDRKYRLALQA